MIFRRNKSSAMQQTLHVTFAFVLLALSTIATAADRRPNILYIMSETYVAPEGIASHMAKGGAEWSGMPDLGPKHGKYGVFMEAGSCSVFTNLGEKMK